LKKYKKNKHTILLRLRIPLSHNQTIVKRVYRSEFVFIHKYAKINWVLKLCVRPFSPLLWPDKSGIKWHPRYNRDGPQEVKNNYFIYSNFTSYLLKNSSVYFCLILYWKKISLFYNENSKREIFFNLLIIHYYVTIWMKQKFN